MPISAVHRIRPRCKRLAPAPAIRSVAGVLSIHHVGSDGQNRLRVESVAIGRIFPELAHECAYDPGGTLIDPVIVIPELREVSFGLEIRYQIAVITNYSDFCVSNR